MKFVFNASEYPYASRRRVVFAKRGMVCTSQPLAAQAGLRILQKGGNAVDAAIATAACMTVLEPTGNGLGSDSFALVWMKDKLYGLNGSGCAPQLMTAENLQAQGIAQSIPDRGWAAVTVPGTPSAWAELHKRFGHLNFAKVLQPAIAYAEEGYPVSPIIQRFWQKGLDLFTKFKDSPEFAGWFSTFAPEGKIPQCGEMIKLPGHARILRLLAATYCEAYYRGEIAGAKASACYALNYLRTVLDKLIVDVEKFTVPQLQQLVRDGRLTYTTLTRIYLNRISMHNDAGIAINAVRMLNPQALQEAGGLR